MPPEIARIFAEDSYLPFDLSEASPCIQQRRVLLNYIRHLRKNKMRRWTRCQFIGGPPAPYDSWEVWAHADELTDVEVSAK
jgi:AAA+ ATPase superfamily predicted ATPase